MNESRVIANLAGNVHADLEEWLSKNQDKLSAPAKVRFQLILGKLQPLTDSDWLDVLSQLSKED